MPSRKTVNLNFWNYFSNFSALGERAEWRLKSAKPVASIVRLNVSDQGDDGKQTSYLVVSKISPTNACVTDIVRPGKNQNARARSLADQAAIKPCRKTI